MARFVGWLASRSTTLDWTERGHSTTCGPTLTTPRYCSPEVANYSPRNSLSDVWSLGCVFLEIWNVLRGQTVSAIVAHLEQRGSMSSCYHLNPTAVASWIKTIRNIPGATTDNAPSAWITAMMQKEQGQRWNIHTLGEQIQEISNNPSTPFMFTGLCCIEDEDTAESVHSSTVQPDYDVTINSKTQPEAESRQSYPPGPYLEDEIDSLARELGQSYRSQPQEIPPNSTQEPPDHSASPTPTRRKEATPVRSSTLRTPETVLPNDSSPGTPETIFPSAQPAQPTTPKTCYGSGPQGGVGEQRYAAEDEVRRQAADARRRFDDALRRAEETAGRHARYSDGYGYVDERLRKVLEAEASLKSYIERVRASADADSRPQASRTSSPRNPRDYYDRSRLERPEPVRRSSTRPRDREPQPGSSGRNSHRERKHSVPEIIEWDSEIRTPSFKHLASSPTEIKKDREPQPGSSGRNSHRERKHLLPKIVEWGTP